MNRPILQPSRSNVPNWLDEPRHSDDKKMLCDKASKSTRLFAAKEDEDECDDCRNCAGSRKPTIDCSPFGVGGGIVEVVVFVEGLNTQDKVHHDGTPKRPLSLRTGGCRFGKYAIEELGMRLIGKRERDLCCYFLR